MLPWFRHEGQLIAGVLERERPSRALRGAPLLGIEAVGFDFSGVDQAGDIRAYGRAVFTERTRVVPDDAALQLPLPSWARSIGYLTELALPLVLQIQPPAWRELAVAWDGGEHRVVFRPVRELIASLDTVPCGEDLVALLGALAPASGMAPLAGEFVPNPDDVWSALHLAASLAQPGRGERAGEPRGDELRFLSAWRVRGPGGRWHELVTPGTGVTVSMLPYLRGRDGTYVLLWNELRPAALERRVRAPLFDLPVPLRYANAPGFFISTDEQALLARDPRALLELLLGRLLPGVRVRADARLGPAAEPDNALSSELRHRFACELDTLPALPEGAFLIELDELRRAVADGLVRDPVVTGGLLSLGVDPFVRAREGDPARRRAYLDRMTEGSEVQRRLATYSSIESEQLQAPTYARLMTLLQHEFGLRIVYPKTEKDRSFFKAAYRVFMAADRGEDRALQGLHFSHDCFHFALGNYTPPAMDDFERWYASGEPAPGDPAPSGAAWDEFSRALKHAENEATFFSFWTLYQEHLPLARHVGKLTFFEAMRDLGYHDRASVWPLYLELVDDARIPTAITAHPLYAQRPDIAGLFEYMRGFRDYQLGDIRTAWKYASRDPYRIYATRFGIYDDNADRYIRGVSLFSARLARVPPGLNPLLAACADVRVELALRVWDVMKGLRLARDRATPDTRVQLLAMAETAMRGLARIRSRMTWLRESIRDAELTARNEDAYEQIAALVVNVGEARRTWWQAIGGTGLVPEATIDEQLARELPR